MKTEDECGVELYNQDLTSETSETFETPGTSGTFGTPGTSKLVNVAGSD